MMSFRASVLVPILASGLFAVSHANAQTQEVNTRVGKLSFDHGLPTEDTSTKLFDELDFQRAVQAYLWALPMVGMAEDIKGQEANTDAKDGDVGIYQGYRNVSVWLTANATTPYIIGFYDLRGGPAELVIPTGAIAGSAMDMWQRPVTDFGITGPDGGKGGKYLLVGPGQETPKADGYHVVKSSTFHIGYFYRALDPDPAKADTIGHAVKIYPFSSRANPPKMKFLTPATDRILVQHIPPRGIEYWQTLAAAINEEPVDDRDRFFMAMLRPLGIEKGKPFQPDERQRKLLIEAAYVGEAMAKNNSFDKRFEGSRYRPESHWDYLFAPEFDPMQDLKNYSQLDERAAYFYEAVATSKGMVSKTPGVGQAYLGTYRAKDGGAFDGSKTYRVRIPANPPAKQFWSVTIYDLDTRCLIQNKQQVADRSSRIADLVKNADGSTDIYVGPEAPKGFEKNWVPSVPGRAWFAYLRLYGPTESYFDKSWPLADFELVP